MLDAHAHTHTHTNMLDTWTKVVSCIHIRHQALQVLFVRFQDAHTRSKHSPPSHTEEDEYSCFQQLAGTAHHAALICMTAIKDTRMPVFVCGWHRGWICVQRLQEWQLWLQIQSQLSAFLATKQKREWFDDGESWLSQDTITWFPTVAVFVHRREMLQKVTNQNWVALF